MCSYVCVLKPFVLECYVVLVYLVCTSCVPPVCLYIRSAGVCLYIRSAGVYLAGLIYEIQYATFSFNQVNTGLVVVETNNRPINSFLDVLFLFQLENMLHTLENTGHVSNGEISTCG